jgi:hypothetical protein
MRGGEGGHVYRVKQRLKKCRASAERKAGMVGTASGEPSLKRAATGTRSAQGGCPVAISTSTAPTDLVMLHIPATATATATTGHH